MFDMYRCMIYIYIYIEKNMFGIQNAEGIYHLKKTRRHLDGIKMIAIVEDLLFWWQSVLLTCDSKGFLKFENFSSLKMGNLRYATSYDSNVSWLSHTTFCIFAIAFFGWEQPRRRGQGVLLQLTRKHTEVQPQFTAWLRGIPRTKISWFFEKS